MEMKINKYCHIMDIGNGSLLLFDSFLKNISVVSRADFEIDEGKKTVSLVKDRQYPKHLTDIGMLINNDIEEYMLVTYQNNPLYTSMAKDEDPSMVLYLTMACNFGCVYCYQNSSLTDFSHPCDDHIFMTDEVIGKSAAIAKRLLQPSKNNTFHLGLFGGEPLLDKKRFKSATDIYYGMVSESNFGFALRTLTNGYLLTDDVVLYLKDIDLKSLFIGITVDGTKEVHDSRRVLKGGAATFDVIMNNIKNLLDKYDKGNLDLAITSIVDKSNFESAVELGLKLHSEGILQKARFNIQPRDVDLNVNVRKVSECGHSCSFTGIESEMIKREFIKRMEKETGILYGRSIMTYSTPCKISAMRGFTIDPVGNVYRCVDDVTYPDRRVGHVDDEKISLFNKAMLEYNTVRLWDFDNCRKCRIMPLCIPQRCIKFRMLGMDCASDKEKMEKSLRLDLFEMAVRSNLFNAGDAEAVKYSDGLFYTPVHQG